MNKRFKIFASVLLVMFMICAVSSLAALASPYDDDMQEITYNQSETAKPDWYPEDINAWTWSAISPDAPRVTDDADILEPYEERDLENKIRAFREKYQTDVVIYTDVTDYGLGHDIFAADIYDFMGYGVGPEHDGFCLFIDMDPQNRGGWCCVTGAPRELYDYENANALDDVLYDYLGRADYYYGIDDWIDNLGTLLEKGVPFAPVWYKSLSESKTRTHDPNVTRVYDTAGELTAEETALLKEKAAKISEKYGVDVVIHVTEDLSGFSESRYVRDFYSMNGYGKGDTYDGVLLCIVTSEGSSSTTPFGKLADKFTERNISRLEDRSSYKLSFGSAYTSANRWLSDLEKTLRTGHTPRTTGAWIGSGLFSTFVGVITGAVGTGSAKSKMKTVRRAYSAGDHLLDTSLNVTRSGDEYLRSDVTRVYSPRSSDSGRSGGSSGGSSHSSSYSGSSGSSHSGSGRHF